ncbi:signal peptidase I [Spirochaetia bacterium]|nr:signal peptidase I [Spirochaetia bacterium]
MFDKWLKYSYAAKKTQRHRFRRVLFWVLVFYIFYNVLTSFVFSVRILENNTMRPALYAGDRLIFSSFALYSLLPDIDFFNSPLPFRRGNIVLVDRDRGVKKNFFSRLADQALRFFTAQRIRLPGDDDRFYVKRVIALPGDEVSMINFVFRVKSAENGLRLTENEFSDRDYKPEIPPVPALWDESLPFSGSMDPIILGEDECFVVSDDRSNTNDSRTWGPVKTKLVTGKLLFRFWPIYRIGIP